MVMKPGERIKVIESTKRCSAGSIGYLAYQVSLSPYNACRSMIVFTRFGKNGMPRVTPTIVTPCIVDYSMFPKEVQQAIEENKFVDRLEPAPDRRTKKTCKLVDTKLESYPLKSRNLLDLPDLHFQAYIVALSLFLRKIVTKRDWSYLTRHISPRLERMFSNFSYTFEELDPKIWATAILYGREQDIKYEVDNFALFYYDQINTVDKKKRLLKTLYKNLAIANKLVSEYLTAKAWLEEDVKTRIYRYKDEAVKPYKIYKKEYIYLNEIGAEPKKIEVYR